MMRIRPLNTYLIIMKIAVVGTLLTTTIQTLFGQASAGCNSGAHGLVPPFIGQWKEYTVLGEKEVFAGYLESRIDLEGCVLLQRFTSPDSSFSYLSYGYVNPASNIWNETYVFNNGNISKYQWLTDGDDMLMLRTGGSRKLNYMHQLRLTNITKLQYDVIEQHSHDGGKTWKDVEVTRIRRQ